MKIAYILNGSNCTGKDTFVDIIRSAFLGIADVREDVFYGCTVDHFSTIDHIRDMLRRPSDVFALPMSKFMRSCLAEKDDDTRKLLADLKRTLDEFTDKKLNGCASNICVVDRMERQAERVITQDGGIPIFFVDCREDSKVLDLKETLTGLGYTVKIVKHTRPVDVAECSSDEEAYRSKLADITIDSSLSPVKNAFDFIINEIRPTLLEGINTPRFSDSKSVKIDATPKCRVMG